MTSLLAQCNFIHHMCKTPPRGFFEQQENPQSFLSCQADDNFSHQNQGWCKILLVCNRDKIAADKLGKFLSVYKLIGSTSTPMCFASVKKLSNYFPHLIFSAQQGSHPPSHGLQFHKHLSSRKNWYLITTRPPPSGGTYTILGKFYVWTFSTNNLICLLAIYSSF